MPARVGVEAQERGRTPAAPQALASGSVTASRVLALQQSAGNRAVARMARARQQVLARYEAGEHVQFGTPGGKVDVGGFKGLDERYLIAMADYYASPMALMNAKADEIKELKALIDRDETARTGGGGTSPSEDEWQKWSEKWRPKDERYMDLNKKNSAHFTPINKWRWQELHKLALWEAQESGKGSGVASEKARIINGFAAHYLTDAFSAGHLIDKQNVMDAAKKSINAGTNRDDLARDIARGILADPKASSKLTGKQIKDSAVMGSWGTPTEARMASLLSSVMYWKESDFLSIFARVAHDDLDEGIQHGKGIMVANKAGDRWQLSGDTTLKLSKQTLDIARKAVKASEDNLVEAAKIKTPAWYKFWEPRIPWLKILAFYDNVWKFVPDPTSTLQAGESQTGADQLKAVIATYTNSRDPQTIRAIVKLSIDQFDTALAQLAENGLIRDAPPPAAAPAPALPK